MRRRTYIRLWYIFWAVPLFLVGGCCEGRDRVVLQYRPEFLQQETATPAPAGGVFDPPYLADSTAWGRSEIHGIDLNRRPQRVVEDYYSLGEYVPYQLYYADRAPDPHPASSLPGSWRQGSVNRVFRYYRSGALVR